MDCRALRDLMRYHGEITDNLTKERKWVSLIDACDVGRVSRLKCNTFQALALNVLHLGLSVTKSIDQVDTESAAAVVCISRHILDQSRHSHQRV